MLIRFAIRKSKEVYFIELKHIIDTIQYCSQGIFRLQCNLSHTTKSDEISDPKNLNHHFEKFHPQILNSMVKIKVRPTKLKQFVNQLGGHTGIIESKSAKKVYIVTDTINDSKYIVKEGSDTSILDEYNAYQRLSELGDFIKHRIPKLYTFSKKDNYYILVLEFIDRDKNKGRELSNHEWTSFLLQAIFFIKILEDNHIRHNAFHLGNLLIQDNGYLKVLNLETVTDYHNNSFPKHILNTSRHNMIRKGWSLEFHAGSDLNQLFGKVLNTCHKNLPGIFTTLKTRIISHDKEFPYAISEGNNEMTANNLYLMFKNFNNSN